MEERVKRAKANYLIQSVVHSLSLLEEFKGADDELGVTELSHRLNLHKNNVFRLLATLETKGYIEQNKATENYRLGVKALQLGQTYLRHSGIMQQARPALETLRSACGETVAIGVLKNGTTVYLDTLESTQSVRVVSRTGQCPPAHATALGKMLLAPLSDEELQRHLGETLEARTPNTIVDGEALRKALSRVESQGYALDHEEFEADVRGVAVPVRDYTRRVVAAIELTGPAYRLQDERMRRDLIPLLLQTAEQLSRRLGYESGLKIAS